LNVVALPVLHFFELRLGAADLLTTGRAVMNPGRRRHCVRIATAVHESAIGTVNAIHGAWNLTSTADLGGTGLGAPRLLAEDGQLAFSVSRFRRSERRPVRCAVPQSLCKRLKSLHRVQHRLQGVEETAGGFVKRILEAYRLCAAASIGARPRAGSSSATLEA
jgi:hypothetical protein